MQSGRFLRALCCTVSLLSSAAPACAEDAGEATRSSVEPRAIPAQKPADAARESDTREAMCLMIESAAKASSLPLEFFARVIWQESRFRSDAIGPVTRSGQRAQGIAQFMPGTASERGLLDPFNPVQALPKSAEFLAELRDQFGNLGLAAAAYNGGLRRVSDWLEGQGTLPLETRRYVIAITGRSADEWAALKGDPVSPAENPTGPASSCLVFVAALRRPDGERRIVETEGGPLQESVLAPWGVQLAGNFVKERALSSYGRVRERHAALLGDVVPMIIGTRLRSRGTRAFYRVRVPAASRAAAAALCDRLRMAGGSCVVLRS
jgi:transglycosylase-like protein with SLT domain/sporulation related protein